MFLIYLLLLDLPSNPTTIQNVSNPQTICPPAEDLLPCTCSKNCPVCPALIVCSNILNGDELEEVFRNTPDWTFWNLFIVNSTFTYLPSKSIVEKRVRNLYLRDNAMQAIFDYPPPDTNQLVELEVTNLVLLGGVRWNVYSTLVHLKELNITNFIIKKIDDTFVKNFPQGLKGLYFRDTKTQKLGDTAFANLANLMKIFVRNTEISALKRSMFPAECKLIAMHFTENHISSLPDDIFSNMPLLRGVGFSDTKITTLPESVFGNIMPQLGLLYFEGNTVDCNCKMRWISRLKVFPKYLRVVCTKPKNLEGVTMDNLEEENFAHCE